MTQFEITCSVQKISERFLIPILEKMIDQLPFVIKGFHAGNCSEYINRNVVNLLNKSLIELTKSRARHINDNALVECKNGAVIRNDNRFYPYIAKMGSIDQPAHDWLC